MNRPPVPTPVVPTVEGREKTVSVLLEFPPAAYALLESIALQGGHGSVSAMVLGLCIEEARSFGEALASDATPEEVLRLFAVSGKEEA